MQPGSFLDTLTEKTLMPLSLVMTLGGIVFWASSIAARADMANERVGRIENREQMILQMREDVARISERVDLIYDHMNKSPRSR